MCVIFAPTSEFKLDHKWYISILSRRHDGYKKSYNKYIHIYFMRSRCCVYNIKCMVCRTWQRENQLPMCIFKQTLHNILGGFAQIITTILLDILYFFFRRSCLYIFIDCTIHCTAEHIGTYTSLRAQGRVVKTARNRKHNFRVSRPPIGFFFLIFDFVTSPSECRRRL